MKKALFVLVPALVVSLAAGAAWFFSTRSHSAVATSVASGKEYYLLPLIVELEEKKPDGSVWDSIDKSAPDPYVEIEWKGLSIFRSSTKRDTLVARWSLSEFDVGKLAASLGKTTLDDTIQAARVSISPGMKVTVKFSDDDLALDDHIGSFELAVDSLLVGDNVFSHPVPGVAKLVLRVIDLRSAPDVFQ